jgi:hypothetical protein
VIGGEDEVDAGVQVVGELRLEDVGLVTDDERLDELQWRKTSSNVAMTFSGLKRSRMSLGTGAVRRSSVVR